MVQSSLPGSFREKLSYQSGDLKEASHSLKAFLPQKVKEGRGDSASKEDGVHRPMWNEQKAKVLV